MSLFKNKYRIESIRLAGYDYSTPSYYFITICTKNRLSYFGNIINNKIILSSEGLIIKKNLQDLKQYLPNINLDAFVIMPNHVHIILIIKKKTFCGVLINKGGVLINQDSTERKKKYRFRIINNPMLSPVITLGYLIRLFKAKSSFIIRKKNKNFYWQTLYYDRIIRNEKELFRIREYIKNNPAKQQDCGGDLENLNGQNCNR